MGRRRRPGPVSLSAVSTTSTGLITSCFPPAGISKIRPGSMLSPPISVSSWCCDARRSADPGVFRKGYETTQRLVPEGQAPGGEHAPDRQGRHRGEGGCRAVAGLEPAVRDPLIQMMDVMEADIAGEPLQQRRQLQIGTAAERRRDRLPLVLACPERGLESVLDRKEPDLEIAGEPLQQRRQLQIGTAAERRRDRLPLVLACPERGLESVLDRKEPDPGSGGQ